MFQLMSVCVPLSVCLSGHIMMILSFRADTSGQTVQTQIRLLLDVYIVHPLDAVLYDKATLFKF